MLAITSLFSLRHFVVSLASISALSTAYAAPLWSDYTTLDRRNEVKVGDKFGTLGKQLSPKSHDKSTVHRLGRPSLKSSVRIIADAKNADHWDGKANPGHVVKQYKSKKMSDHEIKGLIAVGQHVHSDLKTGKIVMKEVPGKPLAHIIGDVKDHGERQKEMEKWKPKVAKAAAHIAETKGVLHGWVSAFVFSAMC